MQVHGREEKIELHAHPQNHKGHTNASGSRLCMFVGCTQKLKSKCSPYLSPEANQRSAVEKGRGSAITLREESENSVPGL